MLFEFVLRFHLLKFCTYAIIKNMVHYSSDIVYYEGGARNPLKSISMKFLVYAWNAQFGVFTGSKDSRDTCNGICVYPYYRGGLRFLINTRLFFLNYS